MLLPAMPLLLSLDSPLKSRAAINSETEVHRAISAQFTIALTKLRTTFALGLGKSQNSSLDGIQYRTWSRASRRAGARPQSARVRRSNHPGAAKGHARCERGRPGRDFPRRRV